MVGMLDDMVNGGTLAPPTRSQAVLDEERALAERERERARRIAESKAAAAMIPTGPKVDPSDYVTPSSAAAEAPPAPTDVMPQQPWPSPTAAGLPGRVPGMLAPEIGELGNGSGLGAGGGMLAGNPLTLGDGTQPNVQPAAPPLPPPTTVNAPPPVAEVPDFVLPQKAIQTGQLPADAPVQGDTPAVPDTSLFGRIMKGIKDHPQTLIALGGGMMGAPTLGQGLGRGFMAASQVIPSEIKQNNFNETVGALMKRGMPRGDAVAAASNPAILQQILPKMFGAKQMKFTQIGEDMLGNKQYGFVDETSGKTYDTAGKEIGGGAGGTGGSVAIPRDANGEALTGKPLLEHLEKTDPVSAAGIKAILAGDMNAGGRNLQKLMPVAALVDPTLRQFDYQTRSKTALAFGPAGKSGQEIKAANTAIGHADQLDQLYTKLKNFDWFPMVNKPWNMIRGQMSPEFNDMKGDIGAKIDALAGELSKAFNGGQTSDTDRAEWRHKLHIDGSPSEQHAAIRSAMNLLHSRLASNAESYNQGMGTNREAPDMLYAQNRPVFDRLRGIGATGGHEASTSPRPPAPRPGKYVYDPATGNLVPNQ